MAITLGSNIASLQAQRQLFQSSKQLSTVFERLSSGQRINRASDDAAGLSIAESLRTDRRVFNQAVRNLNDGVSLLNIADSTVSELSDIIIRIQELAEQAGNGVLSNVQRGAIDLEAQELSEEFFRISRSAEFNGVKLFDGSIEEGVRLQAGYGIDGSIFSSLGGEMGDGTFSEVQTLSTGFGPYDGDFADLNQDGKIDYVVANRFTGGDLTLFFGNGDGTFQLAQTLDGGLGETSLVVADVNNDSTMDLVVSSYSDDVVTVFLGNGNGTFDTNYSFDAGAIGTLVGGDVNGDGALDLVSGFSVFLGNGDGTFQSSMTFETGSAGTPIVGDVDGDGVLDLLTSGFTTGVRLRVGNGDGTFQDVQTISAGDSLLGMQMGDFNGDQALDIATFSPGANDEVVIRLGNGDGTFGAIQTIAVGDGPLDLVIGDVNSDGASDLITVNQGSDDVSILLGRGNGTFAAAQTSEGLSGNSRLNIADFNGDGVLDLVTSDQGISTAKFFLGNTREGIAPILDFSLRTQGDALQAIAPLQRKLESLSEQRGIIGAFQSRLQSAINTLSSSNENYAAAESRIRDADVAVESSNLTRLNILQQAAAAVLSQANVQPQLALSLLSGG